MTDAYPNIDEFGRGATTCLGTMTGCAVCSTANVLVRYGKTIPRLSDGTPDMRTFGARMGAKHRAVDSTCRHGLSLTGRCAGGTNWCTYCSFLQLRAQGISVSHQQWSFAQIEAHLAKGLPLIVPGIYGKVPIVSEGSYTSSKPAKGRSDSGFDLAHMVVVWGVASRSSTGAPLTYYVSDSDFGSPSRPVVPPHSVWSRATLKAYWSALGWSVCIINSKPPAIVAPKPTAKYEASIAKPGRTFWLYHAKPDPKYPDDRLLITSRVALRTGGFTAPCSAKKPARWAAAGKTYWLVELLGGSLHDKYQTAFISSEFAEVAA